MFTCDYFPANQWISASRRKRKCCCHLSAPYWVEIEPRFQGFMFSLSLHQKVETSRGAMVGVKNNMGLWLYNGSEKILKHTDQILVSNCLLAFSFLKGLLPCSFQNFLTPVSVTHEHNTKSTKLKFQVQRTKTLNYGTNLVKNKTISTWNDEIGKLNIKINETSKSSFRHKLITHFSQKYNNDT